MLQALKQVSLQDIFDQAPYESRTENALEPL
jgi:hypothetical protein